MKKTRVFYKYFLWTLELERANFSIKRSENGQKRCFMIKKGVFLGVQGPKRGQKTSKMVEKKKRNLHREMNYKEPSNEKISIKKIEKTLILCINRGPIFNDSCKWILIIFKKSSHVCCRISIKNYDKSSTKIWACG